jgi:hypothetical protein
MYGSSEVVLTENEIEIVFDEITEAYYVVWKPVTAIGSGKTKYAAIQHMREAAHFGIDAVINLILKEMNK